jgi:2,2-dialkylglycine decarboxylase (pyruvate)
MPRDTKTSLALWERYGEYLLMAMPYCDELIADAKGCMLKDVDGNEFLDLAAGQFCSLIGHNHPKLIAKLTDQLQRVLHIGTQFLSPVVMEAAEKFADVAPGNLKRSLFLSTGTEANECAISIAKMYTRKAGVVGFSRGYYGLSLTTKSLSRIFTERERHGDGPLVPSTYQLITPYCFRCPISAHYPECELRCLQTSIENSISGVDNLAAIIVEPVVSAGGMIIPPPGYLKQLKAFAHEHGALLIMDEAQTGFGRTGKWFAAEHHEVEPDILVVSKSAGGGFPVSGLITTAEIADRVAREGFVHLASHQSDPVAAAAVSALIDVVREEGLVQAADTNGAYFFNCLRQLQDRHPLVADVRGQGLMLAMELADPGAAEPAGAELAVAMMALCRDKGVHLTFTYFEPVLRFIPPLTISREQIDTAIAVLDGALSRTAQKDYSLDELLPRNRFSRAFADNLGGKRTVKRLLSRLYETSPQHWVDKLTEKSQKAGGNH